VGTSGESDYGTPPDRHARQVPSLPEPAAGPLDRDVEGCFGVVTIRIPGGGKPGEARVFVRGGHELHIAYSPESLAVGAQVRVDRSRGARAVDVTPVAPAP
jgi:hypothetical protein